MNWANNIPEATLALVFISSSEFVKDAQCHLVVQEIKRHQIPLRVLVRGGVILPKGYFEGITDIRTELFYDQKSRADGIDKLLRKGLPNQFDKVVLLAVGKLEINTKKQMQQHLIAMAGGQ